MGILKNIFGVKVAPRIARRVDQRVLQDTYTLAETLSRKYGINADAYQLLTHAFGEAYICAEINAKVCASATLRLYRRAGRGSAHKGPQGKVVSERRVKQLRRGSYGYKVAEFTAGGAEMVEIEQHPILDLLASPNYLYPGNEMNTLSWLFRWIVGNAYDYVSFAGTTPVLLNPLYAQFVNIVADDELGIEKYTYGRSGHTWGEYSPDEVVHYRLAPNTDSPLYGRSPLHSVIPYADQLRDAIILDIAQTKLGQRPDYSITVPDTTSPDEILALEERIESRFRGVRNWFKPIILRGETKLQTIGWTEREAMTLPKRLESAKIIRRAYGHDESQADSSDSTYAAALMGDSRYLGQTIEPALALDASQKQRMLEMFGLAPDEYAFMYDAMVDRDEAVIEGRLLALVNSGLLNRNEARTELGYDESDDPMANELLVNGQPLGAVAQSDPFGSIFSSLPSGERKPSAPGTGRDEQPSTPDAALPQQAETAGDEGVIPQQATIEETALNGAQIDKLVEVALQISQGNLPKEAGRAIVLAAFPGIPPEKIENIFNELVEGNPSSVSDDPSIEESKSVYTRHMVMKAIADAESPMWKPCTCCERVKAGSDGATPELRAALDRFTGELEGLSADVIADMQDEALDAIEAGREPDLTNLIDQAARSYRDPLAEISRFAIAEMLDDGVPLSVTVPDDAFNIASQRALDFIDRHSFELSGELAQTTIDQAQAAVRVGIDRGLKIDEVADLMSDLPESRARAVARTETNRATNAGRMEGAKATGATEHRIVTAPGVRKSHAAIAAQGVKPIDEPFVRAGQTFGGETFPRDIKIPPFGVNCRCADVAIWKEL